MNFGKIKIFPAMLLGWVAVFAMLATGVHGWPLVAVLVLLALERLLAQYTIYLLQLIVREFDAAVKQVVQQIKDQFGGGDPVV